MLSANNLNAEHMAVLAPVFAKCSNLEILDLWENNIGDKGCIALSNYLPCNLKGLVLADNKIGDYGAIALSSSLPSMLEYLELWRNNIGDDGAIALCNSLPRSVRDL